MGSGCRGCTKRDSAQTGAGIGRVVLEGSGSDAPQHARSLHSAAKGAGCARSRIRTVARRSFSGRSHEINASQESSCRSERLNLLILGGGTGGTIAAWTFAQRGQRVAVIERKYIGGSCPNIACLPSKNVIHSAKVASYLRRSEEFGIAKRDVG